MNVGEVVKVARLFLNTMNKVSSSQTVLHAPLILRGDGSKSILGDFAAKNFQILLFHGSGISLC